MFPIIDLLEVMDRQDKTLMISGPIGTDKSSLARWCHAVSGLSCSFRTVDLQTIHAGLQMAELSGWKKRCFTDAVSELRACVALRQDWILDAPLSTSSLLVNLLQFSRTFFGFAVHGISLYLLNLEHAQAFTDSVIDEGLKQQGDLKKTYRVLGVAQMRCKRNHRQEYRHDQDRVARLTQALSGAQDEATTFSVRAEARGHPSDA